MFDSGKVGRYASGRPLWGVLAALLVISLAWVVPASGGTQDDPPTPIGYEYKSSRVLIVWPDKTRSVVSTGAPVAAEELKAFVASRAAAEGRPLTHGVLAGTPDARRPAAVKRSARSYGSTACSVVTGIWKDSSTTVNGYLSSACTQDVVWQGVSLILYRSANMTIIGSGAGTEDAPYIFEEAGGGCLSSTWQYNMSDEHYITSSVNGSAGFGGWTGPVWISC